MHLAQHRPLAGAAVLGFLAAAVIAGCTMVGDVTGVSVQRASPSQCIRACVNTQDDLLKAEIQLHQANIDACQGLHGRARADCIEAEAARHAAAMDQISEGRRECMNNCHRQGTGSAG